MGTSGWMAAVAALALLGVACAAQQPARAKGLVLYVATNGNDAWSGRLAEPNAAKDDGPLASIAHARDVVRELKLDAKLDGAGKLDGPMTVQVRAGTYTIDKAITLSPKDSGTEARPITYTAYPGESPVLSGGREIKGWRVHKGAIHVADVPKAKAGTWHFRQLFADGKRQVRARFPNVDPKEPLRKGFLYCESLGGLGGFGDNVGCIHNPGDWMDYKVVVPADGAYTVWIYYAALNKPHGNVSMDGRTSLSVEGGERVTLMDMPDTGSWHTMRWARSGVIKLTKGTHKVRWQNHKGGGLTFDAFVLCDDPKWVPKGIEFAPPKPGMHRVLVQAEKFVAYHGRQLIIGGGGGSKTMIGCVEGTAKQAWAAAARGGGASLPVAGKLGTGVPPAAPEAEVHIFQSGSCRAFKEIVKIEGIEPDGSAIRVGGKECLTYLRKGDRYFVENVFEELDAPGEWYLDRAAGKLYYWPPSGKVEGSRIVAPVAGRVFELLGDAEKGEMVEHVTIDGFTIQETDYSPDDGNEGYKMGKEGTVHMVGCRRCTVSNCRFVNIGKQAVCAIDSQGIRVSRCEVAHGAEGGVVLIGSKGNEVSDCTIHHIGAVYKHVGGVVIERGSSDNLVSHNRIHHSARYGITLKNPGQRNIVEFNDVYDLNLETYDTGGIEVTQGSQTFVANSIIRNNVVRDCIGYSSQAGHPRYCSWGIYLDSFVSGYEVTNNVTARNSHGGIMIQGGTDNNVHNNIFVDSTLRQMFLANFRDHSRRNRVERNIVAYADPEACLIYARLPRQEVWQVDHNLYFQSAGKPIKVVVSGLKGVTSLEDWQKLGFDTHSLVADPLFVYPAKDDYTLRPGSPAFKLGFKAIDVSTVGPRPVGGSAGK